MTNKKLAILGIIAAVMVLLVIVQSTVDSAGDEQGDTIKYLIQGLDTSQIKSIEVAGSDDSKATLIKKDEGFVVKELSAYPAMMSKVNDLITKCLDIKVGKVYTSKTENFDDLGVSEDTAGAVVRFFTENDEVITGVVISEKKEGKTFVRRVDTEDAYLAQDSVWINTSPNNFVDKKVAEVEKDEITEVQVSVGGEQYTLTGAGDSARLEGVPEGKKPKQSQCDSVFGAMANLRFDKVVKEEDIGGLNFADTYTAKLSDSTVYTVKLAEKDDDVYAKFDAEFTDTEPVMKAKGVESEEELKKKEAKLLAHEAANKFSKKHSDWVYKLPSYTAENLLKPFEELIEDVEEQPEQQQTQAESAPKQPSEPAQAKADSEDVTPVVEKSQSEENADRQADSEEETDSEKQQAQTPDDK